MKKSEIVKKERKLASKLRTIRLGRGLSQQTLAEMAGVNFKTINRIENNHFSPSLSTLLKLCDSLAVKPSDILK
jgi:DNA-binding XRE family transcriptional regulator